MLAIALGLFACGLAYSVEVAGQCSGNSTCPEGCQGTNATCADVTSGCQENGTCAESRLTPVSCNSENSNCTFPADSTSRLLPGVNVAANGSSEKPLSATAHFSPSPFLGVIPEQQAGSLVIGEVFKDTVGPRHKSISFPNRQVQDYANSRETHRDYQKPSVEIHVGPAPTGYESYDNPGRPEYDNSGKTEYENSGRPEYDHSVGISSYGRPGSNPKPTFSNLDLTAGNRPHGGKDYTNHIDFSGYPQQPFYQGYQNLNHLLKPTKSLPPYQFEHTFEMEKPIQENIGELNHYNLAYPPAVASVPPTAYNHYSLEHGKDSSSNKWKSVLRFVSTVLPLGLLLAVLSPNVLVISPVNDSETTSKSPGSHRSLPPTSGLGECGLRKLCEALSNSPQDYAIFLKAAQQGSTPELQDIIKKAEDKNCSALGCLELRPTEPTII